VYPSTWYWNEIKSFVNFSMSSNRSKEKSDPKVANSFDLDKTDIYKSISEIENVEEARKSFLMVNIYYKEIAYTYISESPKWNIVTLLSNFGGQLGLFIGMSLLSFLEFFDLFIKIIILLIESMV
jgi:hypothetical protein